MLYDLIGVIGKDFDFGVREIVLVKVGDILKQFQALFVIEQDRWQTSLSPILGIEHSTHDIESVGIDALPTNINDGHIATTIQRSSG